MNRVLSENFVNILYRRWVHIIKHFYVLNRTRLNEYGGCKIIEYEFGWKNQKGRQNSTLYVPTTIKHHIRYIYHDLVQ